MLYIVNFDYLLIYYSRGLSALPVSKYIKIRQKSIVELSMRAFNCKTNLTYVSDIIATQNRFTTFRTSKTGNFIKERKKKHP